jgi:hypothetical protein
MKPIGTAVAPCRDALNWLYPDDSFDVLACIFFLRDSLQFEFPNKHIMSALSSHYSFYPFPNARFGFNGIHEGPVYARNRPGDRCLPPEDYFNNFVLATFLP